jgi:2-polyprenyl-3-methyl-5-hydroxy-6-metoxy-1,4-benzoquinol methylase
MLNISQKISYFLDSAVRMFEPKICPVCGSNKTKVVDKKYIVTKLLQCENCTFKFRHPYESKKANQDFYQKEYFEVDGITTDMPNDAQLQELVNSNFTSDANKNVDRLLQLFSCFFDNLNGVKIIDYGASWGYISYQFKKAGMEVQSFEISKPRGGFGNKKLGLNITADTEQLQGGIDIFFSSHVIEHVPSITDMINLAKKLVKPGGFFIALCPNGSDVYKQLQPVSFHKAWGKVHPNFLSNDFYHYIFKGQSIFLATTPINYNEVKQWNQKDNFTGDLSQVELLCIVKL